MLRSLLIRRGFLLLDVVLFFLIACVIYQVVTGFARDGGPSNIVAAKDLGDLPPTPVAPLGARSSYDLIVTSRIFGDAAQSNKDQPPQPPSPEEAKQETELPLTLLGTSATDGPNPLATAVIKRKDLGPDGVQDTYYIGQEVIAQVTLVEVHPREVVLLNKQLNRKEILRQEETKLADAAPPPRPARPGRPAKPGPPAQPISVKRDEVIAEVFDNYEALTKVKAELYRDTDGRVAGVTASNLGELEIAKRLGFRDADVIQTINGEAIDNEGKITELLQKYRDSDTFRIGILRGGKPQTLSFKVD